jgi:hypothetical protein
MPTRRQSDRSTGTGDSRSRSRSRLSTLSSLDGSPIRARVSSSRNERRRIPRSSQTSRHGATSARTDQPSQSAAAVHHVESPSLPSHFQNEPSDDVESSVDPIAEIIMALDLRDGQTMGCAFFETEKCTLFLCADVSMAELDLFEQLLAQIQPTTVLVPGRAPEHLLLLLEEKSNSHPSSQFTCRCHCSH